MRSISEKRRSAAAIKSLLDMMAENRSINSVYTMEGVYQHNAAHFPPDPNPDPDPNPTVVKLSDEEIPSILKEQDSEPLESLGILESRIKLDPIDEQPKMPSPHLSAPILPPISSSVAPRPRPSGGQKVEGLPNSTSVAAISQNLSCMTQNVTEFTDPQASFPSMQDHNGPPSSENEDKCNQNNTNTTEETYHTE